MIWVVFVATMAVVGLAGFLVGLALGQERGVKNEQRK